MSYLRQAINLAEDSQEKFGLMCQTDVIMNVDQAELVSGMYDLILNYLKSIERHEHAKQVADDVQEEIKATFNAAGIGVKP
jgi:hypothetical protein